MSQQLISRNADLRQLRDEGYNVAVVDGVLLLRDVPYVTPDGSVKTDGVIACPLTVSGNHSTSPPRDHVVSFVGEVPCDKSGNRLRFINSVSNRSLTSDFTASCTLSAKPPTPYKDYHQKMTTYVGLIAGPAESISPYVTANTYPLYEDDDQESVFNYLDTASSRAGIVAISDKLKGLKIAIVGVGGTGSYVLDLVAKTPVAEIHLWDGDRFENHTAFRSPGVLAERPKKVTYYGRRYRPMRGGIIAHAEFITDENVDQLASMDFVFVTLDDNAARSNVIDSLTEAGVPFTDTGMGVYERNDQLGGHVRVTTSTSDDRQTMKTAAPTGQVGPDDVYNTNIQVADLNALAAALAVIRFKKHFGFYQDLDREHNALYTIDGNTLDNQGGVDD